jgi:hypothetical protein
LAPLPGNNKSERHAEDCDADVENLPKSSGEQVNKYGDGKVLVSADVDCSSDQTTPYEQVDRHLVRPDERQLEDVTGKDREHDTDEQAA